MNAGSKKVSDGIVGDLIAVLPGWLALMLIDPWTATAAYLPVAGVMILARRTWWGEHRLGGRIVVAVVAPLIALFLTSSIVFRSTGPMLGALLAASIIALAEGWNRRRGRTLLRRYPLLAGLAFLALATAFTMLLLSRGVIRYPTEEFIKVMSAPPEAPAWSREAKEQAVLAVERALANQIETQVEARKLRDKLADEFAAVAASPAPRGVYVTLYETSGYRTRGHARSGRDALEDVLRATAEAARKAPTKARSTRTRPRRWFATDAELRIQIDVVGESRGITFRPIFHIFESQFRNADSSLSGLERLALLLTLTYEIESGVDGIEIHRPDRNSAAVMLPAEVVTEGWFTPRVKSGPRKMRGMLERTWRAAYGEELALEIQDFELRKFRTTCFGRPRAGAKVVDWYRGNVLLEGELTRAELIARIGQAADWLSRRVQQDGAFHYEMHPPFRYRTKHYNLPRHAGSVYSLLDTYQVSRREPQLEPAGHRALKAGLTALSYIERNLKSPAKHGTPEDLCFTDDRGRAESGSTALAAIALCDVPRPQDVTDPELREQVERLSIDGWLQGMGTCMLEMIDADGAVFRRFSEAKTKEKVEKEPLYFPGEVMLALMRSYKRLGEERLLEGAQRIANRQLELYRWPLRFDIPTPGDHWIIQALTELTEATGDDKYAELAVLMGKGYIREQHPPQEFTYPDYLGAYRRIADQPRTTRAASRGEALGAALRAAIRLGEDSTEFEDALILGARHLLEQQFTSQNTHFVPAGWDVQGAIRMGLVDNHCRIDNNQHALIGLFAAIQAIDLRAARQK